MDIFNRPFLSHDKKLPGYYPNINNRTQTVKTKAYVPNNSENSSNHHGTYANISRPTLASAVKFPKIIDSMLPPKQISGLIQSIASYKLSANQPNVEKVVQIINGGMSYNRYSSNIRGIEQEPDSFDNINYRNFIRKLHESIPLPKEINQKISPPEAAEGMIEMSSLALKGDYEKKGREKSADKSSVIVIPEVIPSGISPPIGDEKERVKISQKQMAFIENELAQPILKLENVWLRLL